MKIEKYLNTYNMTAKGATVEVHCVDSLLIVV